MQKIEEKEVLAGVLDQWSSVALSVELSELLGVLGRVFGHRVLDTEFDAKTRPSSCIF